MSKKILAVVDHDLGYVDRFIKYVKTKRNLPFTAVGFSSSAALMLYLERNAIDVLLISDDMATEELTASLRENPSVSELIISGDKQDIASGKKFIFRYRSAGSLLNDIISCCNIEADEENENMQESLDMIAVYSPVQSAIKQKIAISAAHILSESGNVLYINPEPFSGIRKLLETDKNTSLSELIYYFRTNPRKLRQILLNTVMKAGRFDIITAPDNAEDIDFIEPEKWKLFFSTLAVCGGYETIVLDLSASFRRPEVIFSICRRILVPSDGGTLEKERIEEFKEYIADKEGERTLDRIIWVDLDPEEIAGPAGKPDTKDYFESCFSGYISKKTEKALFINERL